MTTIYTYDDLLKLNDYNKLKEILSFPLVRLNVKFNDLRDEDDLVFACNLKLILANDVELHIRGILTSPDIKWYNNLPYKDLYKFYISITDDLIRSLISDDNENWDILDAIKLIPEYSYKEWKKALLKYESKNHSLKEYYYYYQKNKLKSNDDIKLLFSSLKPKQLKLIKDILVDICDGKIPFKFAPYYAKEIEKILDILQQGDD
jgi:hypothetical protein